MTSPTQWTWVWVNSGSWWIGRPGVLGFMGSQRVRHDWATELNWYVCSILLLSTWNYHNIVNLLYSNTKLKVFKKRIGSVIQRRCSPSSNLGVGWNRLMRAGLKYSGIFNTQELQASCCRTAWWLETSYYENIHTIEIVRHYKSGLPIPPPPNSPGEMIYLLTILASDVMCVCSWEIGWRRGEVWRAACSTIPEKKSF